MNKILLGIGIGIIVMVIYFAGFNNLEIQNTLKFLDIIDYEIIQKENSPLFLSVTVSEIPKLETNYGFGWLSEDHEKLSGYISNIHSDSKWHTETITINDVKQFCFDDASLITSNVMINENKINVIIEQINMNSFDKIISYKIIKDNNCHSGFAGEIIDEYKIK